MPAVLRVRVYPRTRSTTPVPTRAAVAGINGQSIVTDSTCLQSSRSPSGTSPSDRLALQYQESNTPP